MEETSPLERLLAERVALCWVAASYADAEYARKLNAGMSFKEGEYLARRCERSYRYFSVLEPDPDTYPWVQEAFSRAAGGEPIRAVHRWVTALSEQARGGRVLTYRAVSLVLASPVYIARAPRGADDVLSRPLGRWAPLADDVTWQRVREYVDDHQRVPHQASQRFLINWDASLPGVWSSDARQ